MERTLRWIDSRLAALALTRLSLLLCSTRITAYRVIASAMWRYDLMSKLRLIEQASSPPAAWISPTVKDPEPSLCVRSVVASEHCAVDPKAVLPVLSLVHVHVCHYVVC